MSPWPISVACVMYKQQWNKTDPSPLCQSVKSLKEKLCWKEMDETFSKINERKRVLRTSCHPLRKYTFIAIAIAHWPLSLLSFNICLSFFLPFSLLCLRRDMGPPATGEAGTQATVTALQWICTPLQASRPREEEGRAGRVADPKNGASGERDELPTAGNKTINYASHTVTF